MADPDTYDRSYGFESYQSSNPSQPLPGNQVDAEFDAVAAAIDGLIAALQDVRRADGALTNGVVTNDALSTTMFTGLVNAVDDAAAASGGVAVGGRYRNGSVLMVRVA